MSGLPGGVYQRLREALVTCGPFDSDAQLQAFFVHELLHPWRYQVPQAQSRLDRVDSLISFLLDKKRSDTQTSALLLFVEILSERFDPRDACALQLAQVARELEKIFQRSSTSQEATQLSLEANPTSQQMIFSAEWLRLLECIHAVGRISVPQIVDGRLTRHFPSGTGWLVASNLVFTCRHVVAARGRYDGWADKEDLRSQVEQSLITFDYMYPGQGIEYRVSTLECEDELLDYALLRLDDRADYPLAQRGSLKLDLDAPLTMQTALWVIQHPSSQPQQNASGRFCRQKEGYPARFFYDAPSEPGTSGAPVLNTTNWRVVALHNGENEKAHLREATLMRAIVAHIEQNHWDIYATLMGIQ